MLKVIIANIALLLLIGCSHHGGSLGTSWQADDYFDDAQVIALCHAIEANDLEEIDRLITAGADVNAIGKDNMTPLLWAFPDNKLERFEKLLEHGADPNVIFKSQFGTKVFEANDSLIHLVIKTRAEGYLEVILKNGGNPNLQGKSGDYPLHLVVKLGIHQEEHIKLLLKAGADINATSKGFRDTPLIRSIGWGAQYKLAVFLLEQGADPKVCETQELRNAMEMMIHSELVRSKHWTPQTQAEFKKLENWFVIHGYDIVKTRADYNRWVKWSREHVIKNFKEGLGYKERAARHAKELAANKAKVKSKEPVKQPEVLEK
ncbi:MAG: ankyrin [Blastopirellula sp.]|nr:MAG: ankyrin [Blastopirellula sp.]